MNEKRNVNETKNQRIVSKWRDSFITPITEDIVRKTLDLNTTFFLKELRILKSQKSHDEYLHSSLSLTYNVFASTSDAVIDSIKAICESVYNQANFRLDNDNKKINQIQTVIQTQHISYIKLLSDLDKSVKNSNTHKEFSKLRDMFIKNTLRMPDILEFESMSILFREEL